MSVAEQFDFFEDEHITSLNARMLKVETSQEKVRKNLFGKMGDMSKMLFELYAQNEQLHVQYGDALSMIASLNERLEKFEKK